MKKVKLITIEDLLEMQINEEKFKLVYVLPEEYYVKGHIPGSINISIDVLEKEAPKKLKKDETIVTYCANYHCRASTNAARKLMEMGYKKVLDFKASKRGWEDAGMDIEKGK